MKGLFLNMVRNILMGIACLAGFHYGWSQDRCAALKQQRIDVSSKSKVMNQFYRLIDCGFDSLDCELSTMFAGELMMRRIQEKGSTDLYFGDVVAIVEELRLQPDYAVLRNQKMADKETAKRPVIRPFYDSTLLCGTPVYLRYFDSFGNTPQYFEYEQALACSRVKQKPLFVYFTGYGCATCQRMEETVLSDPAVKQFLLAHFVIATLYVNGDFPGAKKNIALQKKLGNNDAQPDMYIIDATGKVVHRLGGYRPKDDFLQKLQEVTKP